MKNFILILLLGFLQPAAAAIYYVAQSNPNPAPPYSSWNSAATNIQDAINAAGNGDQILVTNGAYAFGGQAMVGTLTNRVCLNKPVTVQSVNGPWVTFIYGSGATNGASAVRCAWLTNHASLTGFTLSGGATATSGDLVSQESGGGAWCAASNSIVSNCVIMSNTAAYSGGGLYQGTAVNCLLAGNKAYVSAGGGSAYAVLRSCTVVNNSGSGVAYCSGTNCIIYYNTNSGDVRGTGSFAYCCTSVNPGGVGNFTNAPQLFPDGVHLAAGSPCIAAGTNLANGTDIFGQPWSNPPSIGCAEVSAAPLVAQPQIKLTGIPAGFVISNTAVSGQPPFSYIWLQNGVPLQNDGHFNGALTANLAATGVIFSDAASYQLVVSNASGIVTSAPVALVIHCVAANGSSPAAPYSTWATAATNLQDALSIALPGEVVLATNGVYSHGGVSMDGIITNRVSLTNAVLLQSVNGPGATLVQGALDPTATNGPGAVRCAWLGTNAILSGFTLMGGATRGGSGTSSTSTDGGGIYGASVGAVVYNCVIASNFCSSIGGGAFKVTLIQCALTGNQSFSYGGGADGCNLKNCLVSANVTQQYYGGGTSGCLATNCAYAFNSSTVFGGASYEDTLINCTVSKNTSGSSTGYGAAVYGSTLVNCIVYGNFPRSVNAISNYASCTMTYCDAGPLPSGTGNMNVDPQWLADGIHLAATSPCIGAGTESVVSGVDMDGQPWNNPPSIGCDEWQPAPVIGTQPAVRVNTPVRGLTIGTVVAGESPFTGAWTFNGAAIQDNGHYVNSSTPSLVVNNFGPADAGQYQVVVSNAFGVATSQVVNVVIHAVNAAGLSPVAPYSSWATAATNIQDAINSASTGDIVLVTNGVYAFGGEAMAGNLTNRVALVVPLTVLSVNGYAATAIQGAWDPATTNGPGAVRCAYVADGTTLIGFTLQNGATRATGDSSAGGPLESGGGVWCNSTNGTVVNCVLTNNCSIYGGGIIAGTLNGSAVVKNVAYSLGGGRIKPPWTTAQ